MSADQTPTRRPVAVTQRDGSSLQFANCRMASISTGLDFHTRGGKTSTGSKMRTFTTDQSGGTDSGDAKQAWSRGYQEALLIEDGAGWDDVLVALRAGRGVNLDVWHETVGGPCLSGTGRYGHNIFVLPDCKEGAWLVSDPWCKPASWVRVSEAKLRAGAVEWGRRVLDSAGPTEALESPDEYVFWLEEQNKRLMALHDPTHPAITGEGDEPKDEQWDTGGPDLPVLFTITNIQPLQGGEVLGPTFQTDPPIIGKATTKAAINIIPTDGSDWVPVAAGYLRHVSAVCTITNGKYAGQKAYLVGVPNADKEMGLLLASAADYVPVVAPPDPADCDAAVKQRDAEWEDWLMAGSPSSAEAG